jgi:N6-adenosine-specific RNA methylase IME4
MKEFPDKRYNIIYADPPWAFRNKNTGGSMVSGANAHYDTMTIADIRRLPVEQIAADDCVLFMWWVASQPLETLAVVDAWQFKLKTMTGFNWIKKTKTGKDFFGMGFWTRQGSENCLIAVRGKPKVRSHSVRSVVRAENKKHSQKPSEIRNRIVELVGDLPRIELFARERIDSWDSWGDECS